MSVAMCEVQQSAKGNVLRSTKYRHSDAGELCFLLSCH